MPDNNVILTPKVMAGLVLFSLGNNLNVAKNMSRDITPEFAKPSYKIGDTIQVRKPYRFVGGEGLEFDPEPLVDQVTPVIVNQTPHVHFQWNIVEKTMSIRNAMKLYGDPAGLALASKINAQAATFAADNALNSVGTPGTAPTSMATYLAAGDVLVEMGLPEGEELNMVVNRRMSSAYLNGVSGLFNSTAILGNQMRKGVMQDQLGYNVLRDQTINTHTNGTWTTVGLINGAQTAEGGNNATMTLNTDGWTSGGTSLKAGDRFVVGGDGTSGTSATVGGVESVYPQTRKTNQRQQVFTIQNDISDTTGTVNMVVAPAITPATLAVPGNQYANVNIAAPDNGIITMIGSSGATATQGLLLHEKAFAFVSVPMEEPPAGTGLKSVRVTDPETGLSIMYSQFTRGQDLVVGHRYDSLVGFGNMYREMAVVIQA